MGKYSAPADAWKVATLALMRYQENKEAIKREYERITIPAAASSNGRHSGRALHADPTANKAIRLYNDIRYQKLKQEIYAVEKALEPLPAEHKEIIYRRFFNHPAGVRTPKGYDFMQDIGYSPRQMKRIVQTVIYTVAHYLGEMCLEDVI